MTHDPAGGCLLVGSEFTVKALSPFFAFESKQLFRFRSEPSTNPRETTRKRRRIR